jgi:hypothetical protein
MEYRFRQFSPAEITPEGWLRNRLEDQKDGLTGHVGEIWKDLSDDSTWLGGKGEAWERGPYYLDGLIPLAHLLKDEKLLKLKDKWLEGLFASVRPDGNFGPLRNPDVWPRMVAMKALLEEYDATEDERVFSLLIGYAHFLDQTIETFPPKFWASARALECLAPIIRLYEITHESFLIGLAGKLKTSMPDWSGFFRAFPYPEPTGRYLSRGLFRIAKDISVFLDLLSKNSQAIRRPETASTVKAFNENKTIRTMMMTHGVNIAMALKYATVFGMFTDDVQMMESGKAAYETVMEHHGTPIGIHTADEHLSGHAPFQGTELCAVVEEMYSFEQMLQATGDPYFADRLEFLAMNALPATFTDHMTKHQYVQQVNQIAADQKSRPFFDTNREGNVFGLAPNFGCCLANMHQGFPKYARNLVFKTEDGIAVTGYAPLSIDGELFGSPFRMRIEGDYPYDGQTVIRLLAVSERAMKLELRMPEFAKTTLLINGKEEMTASPGFAVIERIFAPNDEITLQFKWKLVTIDNPDGTVSFRQGPILFAMPIQAIERKIRGNDPFCDIELTAASPWNQAPILASGRLKIIENPQQKSPIPFKIQAEGIEIPNWKPFMYSAGKVPVIIRRGKKKMISLIPYGETRLRIAAFPKVDEG